MNTFFTSNFLWGVLPYVALTIFFVVPFLRMIYRPFGLTTRASGIFLGRDTLGLAAHLLHWGIFLTFFGHLAGLIGGVMGAGGWVSAFFIMATLGGLAAITGSAIALVRRVRVPEMRAMSQPDDYIVHLFLIAILGIALYQGLVHRIWGVAFTAGPWFASLWRFAPQPELMASAPLLSKIHISLAFLFAAYFPFTKLIHAWTFPINYAVRPYQVLRTTALKFQNRWEYAGTSDKGYMTYATLAAVVALFALSFLLPGPASDAFASSGSPQASGKDEGTDATRIRHDSLDGYPLYVSQCARCHGLDGTGDGPGAGSPTFAGTPRNLTAGRYRYVSTTTGIASDADLRRTIRTGLPGSGMPAFTALDDRQVNSLVAVLDGFWHDRPSGAEPIEIPPRPQASSDLVAAGKTLYAENCAACHGDRGRGDGPAADGISTLAGVSVAPRDLAQGVLRGGKSAAALYRRISAGIPDGPDNWLMPPFGYLEAGDIWALVAYLEADILPPGTRRSTRVTQ